MYSTNVTVMGAGVAGLAAALLLARDGHRVHLVERDDVGFECDEDPTRWRRKGVPHFLQPHAIIPRGRNEMRLHWSDVYQSLLDAGAHEVDARPKLPGVAQPDDEELQYLAVRRPMIERALRQAVLAEESITVLSGARVTGVRVTRQRVSALEVDGSPLATELLVDAAGRRSEAPHWLEQAGVDVGPVLSSDCGVVYYSRYYQLRNGYELPDGPWLLGPRGDLGYISFTTFPGDNGTFAVLFAVPTGVPQWRALKEPDVFERVVASIPSLGSWVDRARVDPLTSVLTMAGLHNTLRLFDSSAVEGYLPIGDALTHTDPVLAHGLSFGLIHAAQVAASLRDHEDLADASSDYATSTAVAIRERYELATALDEQRLRMWTGGSVSLSAIGGDSALFSLVAVGAVAPFDGEIMRVFVRRMGLLDSTTVLDGDAALLARIEVLWQSAASTPRPPQGPSSAEMREIIGSTVPLD
jgi:2-polyprenyl-6-methoxyphenol hydroxylase-like FAD-dependent oxidoreductase